MIVKLDFIIALNSMMHVLGLDNHELHHMEDQKKIPNNFLIGKLKFIVYVTKIYLFDELYFSYMVEAFMTLNQKS